MNEGEKVIHHVFFIKHFDFHFFEWSKISFSFFYVKNEMTKIGY